MNLSNLQNVFVIIGKCPTSPSHSAQIAKYICVTCKIYLSNLLRGIIKKKREKAVRLTAWGGGGVTPLQPDRFYFVKILTHFVLYKKAK